MPESSSRASVLGVQVGRVQLLEAGGRVALSGIRKQEARGPVAVGALGLAGDEQADLTVHGGLSKALYAYPVEHYDFWIEQRRALGLPAHLPYGSLGENLTLSGVLEGSLFVGDTLSLPDCVLRVTQPRTPCWKFNAVMGDPLAARKMVRSGRSGFYLSVVRPGSIEAGQPAELRAGPRELPLVTLLESARARLR